MLAAMVVAVAEVKTTKRNLHPWNEGSSCAKING